MLGLLLAAACGHGEKPAAAPRPGATPTDDAALLGAEIFDVVDQVVSASGARISATGPGASGRSAWTA